MNIFDIESYTDSSFTFTAPITREKLYLLINQILLLQIHVNAESLEFKCQDNTEHLKRLNIINCMGWGDGETLIRFSDEYIDPLLGLFLKLSGHCFDGTAVTDNGKVVRIKFLARFRSQLYIANGYMVLNPLKQRYLILSPLEQYPKEK